jgi:uncharacterized coiled-coil protein SlyX
VAGERESRERQLRAVIATQHELLAAKDALEELQGRQLAAQRAQLDNQSRLIETLSAAHAADVELIEGLRAQLAELARRLGMDSTNSSTPPSKDRPGADPPG